MSLKSAYSDRNWAMVLAGGDGTRLRPLTRRITGDERPKQFCPIIGGETLLERTLRRTRLAIPEERTLTVVTETHESFYSSILGDAPAHSVVVQPVNRGTTPAILYGLLRAASIEPESSTAIFPSDHYIFDDEAFMFHVEAAFEAVRIVPELIVLFGINPKSPEVEYGWIEPAEPIFLPCTGPLFRVGRFWEKPHAGLAKRLLSKGCFWNSFVMVGRTRTLLSLTQENVPELFRAFDAITPALNTPKEMAAVRSLYHRIAPSNFSQEVLAASPSKLSVLPVTGIEWSDWGEPARVLNSLASIGIQPEWAPLPLAASA